MIRLTREQVMNLPTNSLLKCICQDGDTVLMKSTEPNRFSTLLSCSREDLPWIRWMGAPVALDDMEYALEQEASYHLVDDYKSKLDIEEAFTRYLDRDRSPEVAVSVGSQRYEDYTTISTHDIEFSNGATASWATPRPAEPLRGTLTATVDAVANGVRSYREQEAVRGIAEATQSHVDAVSDIIRRGSVTLGSPTYIDDGNDDG